MKMGCNIYVYMKIGNIVNGIETAIYDVRWAIDWGYQFVRGINV